MDVHMSRYISTGPENFDHLSMTGPKLLGPRKQYAYVRDGISLPVLDLALNLVWLGTVWGAAVGILIGDVVYAMTDHIEAFLLLIPFALVGYYLGRRAFRKHGSFGGMKRERM
jgi:hypothetical protein